MKMAATKALAFLIGLLQSVYSILAPSAGDNNRASVPACPKEKLISVRRGVDNTTHSCRSQLVVAWSFQPASKSGPFGTGENNATPKMSSGLRVGGGCRSRGLRTDQWGGA